METMFDRIKRDLRRDEGLSLRVYVDRNVFSIGWGHQITDPEVIAVLRARGVGTAEIPTLEITEAEAERLFNLDVAQACKDAATLFTNVGDIASEARRRTLVCLVFQLGATQLRRGFPQFVAAVDRQDWQRAADELLFVDGLTKTTPSDYSRQTPERAQRYTDVLVEGKAEIPLPASLGQAVGLAAGGNG
jgi:GH24 family phage-related lysozyme (muramidase)